MNLVIDIGNTCTKYLVYNKGIEIDYALSDFPDLIEVERLKADNPLISKSILSASGSVPEEFQKKIQNIVGHCLSFNSETPVPFKSLYETPKTLGLDRKAAVAGAHSLYPETNTLIIDAGTAITYDFIDSDNIYRGGNISPGLAIRFKSLHQHTSKLPLLSAKDPIKIIGQSTNEAINNGVVYGIVYEIEGIIGEFENNYKKLTVLLTGGDAQFFDYKVKKSIFVVSNLVSIGLNTILNYNVAIL